ncbi:MAG: retroviral-like aspartic protease family protein [Steroidobacteraceae bacterium]
MTKTGTGLVRLRAELTGLAAVLSLVVPAVCQAAAAAAVPPELAAQASPAAADVAPDEAAPEFATPTTVDRAGRIIAPVEINGRGPFKFILDTGANRSAMSAATAEALGLVPDEGALVSVHGITGSAVLPVVNVVAFRAGDLVFEDQRLPVLPAAVFDAGVHGILGIDSLQQARIEVDFVRDSVTIRRSQGRSARKGQIVVPARLHYGGLLLVDGRVGGVSVKAILDSGAERSLGNEALRTALDERARHPKEGVATKVIGATPQVADATSIAAPAIEIGGATLKNLTVTYADLHVFDVWSLLDEPALLIGMDLLGALEKFVVDYPRREFHLKPVGSRQPSVRRCGGTECQSRIPQPGT